MKKTRNLENRYYYRNPMTNLKPENYSKNTKAKMNYLKTIFFLANGPQKHLVTEPEVFGQ